MTVTAENAPQRRAAERMREAFEAVARHDLDHLEQAWDDRTTGRFHSLNLEVQGREALREFFAGFFAAIEDLGFEVEAIHDVDESTAVGQWRLTGTFSGRPFQGIQPTGRTVDIRGIDVMTFDGPHVRVNDVYYDGLSFVRQIGMLPAEGSATDRVLRGAFNALTGVASAWRGGRDR